LQSRNDRRRLRPLLGCRASLDAVRKPLAVAVIVTVVGILAFFATVIDE
jgi:hypothetical protein